MQRIRTEGPRDAAALRALHQAVFEGPDEPRLVADLRASGEAALALIAELDGAGVGLVLRSPVRWGDARRLGLAPMAVRPERQRRGLVCAWDPAGEALFAPELVPGAPEGVAGRVRYAAPFDAV